MNIKKMMNIYLKEIKDAIDAENDNVVISLINDMKSFYMTEKGLKSTEKKLKRDIKKEKPVEIIRKEIQMDVVDPNKPRKHIFY